VIFSETPLRGAFLIEPERLEDQRGFFARTWCEREFRAHGLETRVAQCSMSMSRKKGTLRGMHYQAAPAAETKIIRCTRGALHDVIIDLRSESPTFMQYFAVVLSPEDRRMLYVPAGFAHGFQTVEDDTEVAYQMSEFHAPEHARGIRWDDPAFRIQWPDGDRTILERDRNYPDFRATEVAR
jgi:dTDP-4-dehydrorhamnose 3,5-epimerase